MNQKKKKLKTYTIPVTWQMYGECVIEAKNLEEAKQKALKEAPIPEGTYVDESMVVQDDDIIEGVNEG